MDRAKMKGATLLGGPHIGWPEESCGATRATPRGRSMRKQLPPELRHPPPERAIEHPFSHPHNRTTQNLRLHRKGRDHLFAQLAAQGVLDGSFQLLVRISSQCYPRAHPVELLVQQI